MKGKKFLAYNLGFLGGLLYFPLMNIYWFSHTVEAGLKNNKVAFIPSSFFAASSILSLLGRNVEAQALCGLTLFSLVLKDRIRNRLKNYKKSELSETMEIKEVETDLHNALYTFKESKKDYYRKLGIMKEYDECINACQHELYDEKFWDNLIEIGLKLERKSLSYKECLNEVKRTGIEEKLQKKLSTKIRKIYIDEQINFPFGLLASGISYPYSRVELSSLRDPCLFPYFVRVWSHELFHQDGHNDGNAELNTYEFLNELYDYTGEIGFRYEASKMLSEATLASYWWLQKKKGHTNQEIEKLVKEKFKFDYMLEDKLLDAAAELNDYISLRLKSRLGRTFLKYAELLSGVKEKSIEIPQGILKKLENVQLRRKLRDGYAVASPLFDMRKPLEIKGFWLGLWYKFYSLLQGADSRGPYTIDMYRKWKAKNYS
jgi:hypothetical protein